MALKKCKERGNGRSCQTGVCSTCSFVLHKKYLKFICIGILVFSFFSLSISYSDELKVEQKNKTDNINSRETLKRIYGVNLGTCIIKQDRTLVKGNEGTILDLKNRLMWASKDNAQNINWYEAKKYCKNYRGGGYSDWRLPTAEEMYKLYLVNREKPQRNEHAGGMDFLTTLIETTGTGLPWVQNNSGAEAGCFHFGIGEFINIDKNEDYYRRVLPVRSVKNCLYIKTTPKRAKIKILNNKCTFYQGIELNDGVYNIKISANKYKTETKWIKLFGGNLKKINVQLQRSQIKNSSDIKKIKEIDRDGNLIAYDTQVILDTKNNLMWGTNKGKGLNWVDADIYCKNYRGLGYSDWRLPTVNEISTLYTPNKKESGLHITKLINVSLSNDVSYCIWTSEKRGAVICIGPEAAYFSFFNGRKCWSIRTNDNIGVIPVRKENSK